MLCGVSIGYVLMVDLIYRISSNQTEPCTAFVINLKHKFRMECCDDQLHRAAMEGPFHYILVLYFLNSRKFVLAHTFHITEAHPERRARRCGFAADSRLIRVNSNTALVSDRQNIYLLAPSG